MGWIIDADDWGAGASIHDSDTDAQVRAVLEESPVIVEHRFYRAARAPERRIFEGYEEYRAYVVAAAQPGDSFYIWPYEALCRDDNHIAHGKVPDPTGRVPRLGAY